MLLRHNNEGESQLIYEFFSEKNFATSPWFTLPSMGIPIEHDHYWVVIMRKAQRTITSNWSDLNALLIYLQNHYQKCGQIPAREEILSFLEDRFDPEEWDKLMHSWFTLPWEEE